MKTVFAIEQARRRAGPGERYLAGDVSAHLGEFLTLHPPERITVLLDPPAAGVSVRVLDLPQRPAPGGSLLRFVQPGGRWPATSHNSARTLQNSMRSRRSICFPQTAEIEVVAHLVKQRKRCFAPAVGVYLVSATGRRMSRSFGVPAESIIYARWRGEETNEKHGKRANRVSHWESTMIAVESGKSPLFTQAGKWCAFATSSESLSKRLIKMTQSAGPSRGRAVSHWRPACGPAALAAEIDRTGRRHRFRKRAARCA